MCRAAGFSVFASAVADLYRNGIKIFAQSGASPKLNNEELKISVEEIVSQDFDLYERIGYLLEELAWILHE